MCTRSTRWRSSDGTVAAARPAVRRCERRHGGSARVAPGSRRRRFPSDSVASGGAGRRRTTPRSRPGAAPAETSGRARCGCLRRRCAGCAIPESAPVPGGRSPPAARRRPPPVHPAPVARATGPSGRCSRIATRSGKARGSPAGPVFLAEAARDGRAGPGPPPRARASGYAGHGAAPATGAGRAGVRSVRQQECATGSPDRDRGSSCPIRGATSRSSERASRTGHADTRLAVHTVPCPVEKAAAGHVRGSAGPRSVAP